MTDRQTHSLDDIKDMLLAQLDAVVHHYAPPAKGSYTDKGLYFTLNPGRADRSVGSFCVHMTGSRAGRWNDYATGSRGDLLDLINLSLHGEGQGDLGRALKEARAYLGLDTQDPAAKRRLEDNRKRAGERRRQAERDEREKRNRRRNAAQAIWLSGSAQLRGTPVDLYLRQARGIELDRLGRAPGVLRYVPSCRYQHVDRETGEVFEGEYPVMAAAITDATGGFAGVHRTYLACIEGTWQKAPVPAPRKVLGDAWGHSVNVWRGAGPRGGKPASLPQCPPGTHVYIAEGVEDALSVAILLPAARVVAAISLGGMGAIKLPENVASVTLVADQDENPEAREVLLGAIEAHRAAGREVRLWQNQHGGKDLNDALRAALQAQAGAA